MDSSTWAVADHSAHPAAEDDFQQFLDMNGMGNLADGINYNFQHFQSSSGPQLLQSHPREQLDIPMSGTDAPILLSPAVPSMQHQMPAISNAGSYQTVPATMMPPPTPSEAIVDSIDAQIQFLQQQKLRHQQRRMEEQQVAFFARQQTRMVPPTPQSLEIQPRANQYYAQSNAPEQQQQQQQSMEYRYQRLKDQSDMSFTPLVSPAVTPLDTHFSVDSQFAVSGAYFSPLTSPALHAQNDPLAMFDQIHSAVSTSSPVEMELDSTAAPAMPNSTPGDLAKKTRKNAAKARAKPGIKQSPISKPLRRRTVTTPSLNAQVLSELAESVEQNQDPHLLPTPMMQTSSSSTTAVTDPEDSVSPESLNDTTPVEMPPPPIPKPRSAKPSPFIAPQASAVPSSLQSQRPCLASPATPASLMKLSSPNARGAGARAGSHDAVDTDHIETFELPESANFPNRSAAPTSEPTPTQPSHDTGSARTPSLVPPPSPSVVRPAGTSSATQSPQLLAGSGLSARKTPQLLPRGSKKRGSVSSIPVSPALRPKISPNIKPLLPGGPDVEEAASHLLATKSNYQRILEGNTVPGVSYPSELSTNLTSKRTSHKIAEQGRRNRINSALQEIATLLPRPPKDSEGEVSDSKDGKKDKSGGVPNSKASTVEMAIEYIKQLQKEVAEANRRAEEAEKRLELKVDSKMADGEESGGKDGE
ncbi:helix-loop-helix DNA-binding domain-containing protein [Chaetomium strumarium]|uniref:Helix-loop-helix DNA-binding domain-containing protein n=1 Tax=Chaetomium strumarium TaxID=1170767 RepID=A0AAJ0M665_9PEZI|nr:helix-loop-helix DNA-binding domain-containing protein [Chaetomium strumarium]